MFEWNFCIIFLYRLWISVRLLKKCLNVVVIEGVEEEV